MMVGLGIELHCNALYHIAIHSTILYLTALALHHSDCNLMSTNLYSVENTQVTVEQPSGVCSRVLEYQQTLHNLVWTAKLRSEVKCALQCILVHGTGI